MGHSNAKKERLRAQRAEKYGADWRPARCPFCVNSEPVRKAAVTLPATDRHPAPRTIFCAVSLRQHPEGTVVKTEETARWRGNDDRRVPIFRFPDAGDPPDVPRFRVHNATNCVDPELNDKVNR